MGGQFTLSTQLMKLNYLNYFLFDLVEYLNCLVVLFLFILCEWKYSWNVKNWVWSRGFNNLFPSIYLAGDVEIGSLYYKRVHRNLILHKTSADSAKRPFLVVIDFCYQYLDSINTKTLVNILLLTLVFVVRHKSPYYCSDLSLEPSISYFWMMSTHQSADWLVVLDLMRYLIYVMLRVMTICKCSDSIKRRL